MFKISSLIALASLAFAQHDFSSESHFICQLCHQIQELQNQNDREKLSEIFQKFPGLNKYFPNELDVTSNKFCENLQMCQTNVESDITPDYQPIVDIVNNSQNSWQSEIQPKFQKMTQTQIKKMMGTIVDPDWTVKAEQKKETREFLQDVPKTFDAREQWPECADVIGHIRDQANCGSCWAFGTTEAYNDRLCIKTGGNYKTLLSTADTTGCCGFTNCFSFGCNGGQVGTPWSWFQGTGVVSGAGFGDKDTCYPYTMPFCAHHVEGTQYPDCSSIEQVEPTCGKKCQNSIDYRGDKQRAQSSYGLSDVDSIKRDLVQYGSVTAAFTVYEDFVNYKSGVYRHTSGSALGGHAVKIIGYGEDYWIVNNSWNNSWGDNGTFKIAFGECGIENQCHAGLA